MNKIKGILIDVLNEQVKVVTIEDELAEFYKILDCHTIDIVRRKIGNKWYTIVCDDEGLIRDNPKISAINNLGKIALVGNLFICNDKQDDDGTDLDDLSAEDIKYLMQRIHQMCTYQYPDGYPMLTHVVDF